MRRLLRDIAEGRELGDVTTLRDPDVVKELDEIVTRRAKRGRRGVGNRSAFGDRRAGWKRSGR